MTRTLVILAIALGIAASGTALAATPAGEFFVSAPSTTAGVATLELIDPVSWSGRSVPARSGVFYGFCDRGPLRPCALRYRALAARRRAFELAKATFRDTDADLVVVGLRQSRTSHVLLVFERDLVGEGLDPLAATADNVYAMGGLVPYSEGEDSLLLVKLRPWRAAQRGL